MRKSAKAWSALGPGTYESKDVIDDCHARGHSRHDDKAEADKVTAVHHAHARVQVDDSREATVHVIIAA